MGRNIEKNPFSLYDFLGHFIPGAMALIILFIIYQGFTEIKNGYFDVSKFCEISTYANFINRISKYNIGIIFISFILASYISGTLISYLSSQTIEIFLTRTFGYPSEYLLSASNNDDEKLWKRYFKSDNCMKIILYAAILLLLFPISLFVLFFGNKLKIREYITRPLGKGIISSIKKKEKLLAEKLLIKNYKDINDFHRVIMHYVYMNLDKSEVKTDNYIALYGFFRSITLILCLYFDFLLAMGFYSFFIPGKKIFDCYSFMFIGILGFLCFISFMAFAKFYRRFTLENYMMLLSDTTIIEKERKIISDDYE